MMPENLRQLVCALEDPEEYVRSMAARELGDLGDASAVTTLVSAMSRALKRGNEYFLVECAFALGKLHDATAVEPLLELLLHRKAVVRYAAVVALSGMGDARALGPLRELQHTDNSTLPCIDGGTTPVSLSEAARVAIDRIRGR